MMIKWVVSIFAFSSVQAAIPPYLNCTRYLEPCISRKGDCCGYPFYDCLSNGREPLCQSIQDFPELSAELLLRLRAARDRGDPEFKEIHKDVYGLVEHHEGGNKGKKSDGKKSGNDSKKKKDDKSPKKSEKKGKSTKKEKSPKKSDKKSKSTKKKTESKSKSSKKESSKKEED